MSRRQANKTRRRIRAVSGSLPDDLYDYIDKDMPISPESLVTKGRGAEPSFDHWIVSDDWPERVPVTEAEIDLFEAWFGDIIDGLFGKPG